MRHRFRCAGVLLACLTVPVHPALACRVSDPRREAGHDWPGWLVDSAQAIARVRAVGPIGPAPEADTSAGSGTMAFAVLEWIRGPAGARPHRLAVAGTPMAQDDYNAGPVPYTFVRSDGAHGDCFASRYRVGAEYLLLLRRDPDDQSLSPYWAGLAPVDEQVRGTRDAWVVWVRGRAGRRRRA